MFGSFSTNFWGLGGTLESSTLERDPQPYLMMTVEGARVWGLGGRLTRRVIIQGDHTRVTSRLLGSLFLLFCLWVSYIKLRFRLEDLHTELIILLMDKILHDPL